jgi:hypothetical protein
VSSAAVKFLRVVQKISGWAVLDTEGGHVTIQGPSPDPSPTEEMIPRAVRSGHWIMLRCSRHCRGTR